MDKKIYTKMGLNFPFLIRDGIKFLEKGDGSVIVKLKDGSSVLYEDDTGIMRTLPKDSNNMSTDECKKEFGYRLYRLMLRKGMTQRDLSDMTGIPRYLISNYITGKASPSFCNADKIAKVLECSMDDLRYIE